MQKKALLALMMALIMLVTAGCSLIKKDEAVDRATTIVSVYDDVYTKGEINDSVNYQLQYMSYLYSMYGYSYDTTDAQNISDAQDSVINSLVETSVKNHKAAELGLDQLTEEEEATVTSNAESDWQDTLDTIKTYYFADSELTGDELDAAVEEYAANAGYSYEKTLESDRTSFIQDKLEQYVYDTVTSVDDSELQAYIDEKAETAKSNYESSPASYGTAFNNGTTVYYRPAGYRLVKQILVKYTEEDQAVLDTIDDNLDDVEATVTDLTTQLSDAGVENVDELVAKVTVTMQETADTAAADESATPTDVAADATPTDMSTVLTIATATDVAADLGDDISEENAQLIKDLAVAEAQAAFLTAQKEEATRIALGHIDAKADQIIDDLNNGADWDEEMAKYTEDPGMQEGAATATTGYAVSSATTNMDTAFVNAAMALENVGDVSPKTAGIYGYYIIQYTSDVEEGPVTLDELRDKIYDTVLSNKQSDTYDAQLETWVTEVNAKINKDELNK